MAVDSKNAYWIDTNAFGKVYSAPLQGDGGTQIVSTQGGVGLAWIAADGVNVYWSNEDMTGHGYVTYTPAGTQGQLQLAQSTGVVTVGGGYVFWVDGYRIGSTWAPTPTRPANLVYYPTMTTSTPVTVTANDKNVYWAEQSCSGSPETCSVTIYSLPIGSPTYKTTDTQGLPTVVKTLTTHDGWQFGLAAGPTNLFISDTETAASSYAVPGTGCTASPNAASRWQSSSPMLVAGTKDAYLGVQGTGILRIGCGGDTNKTMAYEGSSTTICGLAADSKYIYWLTSDLTIQRSLQ